MAEDELDLRYDFICICCGGRNGEDHPDCSIRLYPMDRTEKEQRALSRADS